MLNQVFTRRWQSLFLDGLPHANRAVLWFLKLLRHYGKR